MQPTPATNETRLPRAVVRQMQILDEKRKARTESEKPPAAPAPGPAETQQDPPAAPAIAATPVEPPPAPPAVDRESDPAYWKQRFKVTEGILASERARNTTAQAEQNQRITDLSNQVAQLQAKAADAPIDIREFFSDADIEKYGEEQCRVMATAAAKAAKSVTGKTAARVEPPAPAPTPTANPDADVQFQMRLTELDPNWQAEDQDPRWRAWLAERNGRRQKVIDAYVQSRDADAIVDMLADWKATLTPTPAPAPTPVPPVAPRGSGAAPAGNEAPPTSEQVQNLTAPTDVEVKAFFTKSALGKVKDAERVAFEARMKLRQKPR